MFNQKDLNSLVSFTLNQRNKESYVALVEEIISNLNKLKNPKKIILAKKDFDNELLFNDKTFEDVQTTLQQLKNDLLKEHPNAHIGFLTELFGYEGAYYSYIIAYDLEDEETLKQRINMPQNLSKIINSDSKEVEKIKKTLKENNISLKSVSIIQLLEFFNELSNQLNKF